MSIIKLILAASAIITPAVSFPVGDPFRLANGLFRILNSYTPPSIGQGISPKWLPEFSRGIVPIPCHSHNDYEQKIPLYQSLSVGCVSTEVDMYVRDTKNGKNLLVGHNSDSLDQARTLKSLYLDPLKGILEGQNLKIGDLSRSGVKGVYDESPETSFVLLVDFKDSAAKTWDLFMGQLDDLRQKEWLTYWKPDTGVVQGPLTVVVTGAASFNDVVANVTYRDIFYDAPLNDMIKTKVQYDTTNSYYASGEMKRAIGKIGHQFSDSQNAIIEAQVQKVTSLGLKTRYWGATGVPESTRNMVWKSLVDLSVSILNIDELVAFRDWYNVYLVNHGGKF